MNLSKPNSRTNLMRSEILNQPLMPLLLKMSLPTIIGMLVMVIYNLTDTFFIGLLNDRSMTAAIGIVFSFTSVIQAIGFWLGYGSGNLMSKEIGAGDKKEAEVISSIGVFLAIVTGILILALSEIFLSPLVDIMCGGKSVPLSNFTMEYMGVIAISIPFALYSITLYNQLRLCGNVKEGTIGLFAGMAVNMVLDPLLIFCFDLGFVGAAYATIAGQISGSIVLTIYAENTTMEYYLKGIKLNRMRIYHILAGGMPNFSRQIVIGTALILLNRVASQYGDDLIAALTISSRISGFVFMIMIGWSQGFQPICAMNYGAMNHRRVKESFKVTVIFGTAFLTIAAVIMYFFSETLMNTMTGDRDVILIGSKIIRMQCFTLPTLSYFATSSMLMQNTGKYLWALIISISRQGIFYIPILFVIVQIYGQQGIYWLQPAADILSCILASFLVRKEFFNQLDVNYDQII